VVDSTHESIACCSPMQGGSIQQICRKLRQVGWQPSRMLLCLVWNHKTRSFWNCSSFFTSSLLWFKLIYHTAAMHKVRAWPFMVRERGRGFLKLSNVSSVAVPASNAKPTWHVCANSTAWASPISHKHEERKFRRLTAEKVVVTHESIACVLM